GREHKEERDTQQAKTQRQLAGCGLLCVCGVSHRCRLSRPKPGLQERFAMESAAGAALRPSIRACFLMGVLRDARLGECGATMCQFSTKEGKTTGKLNYEQGPCPASLLGVPIFR